MNKKVQIDKVLDDMYADKGIISFWARDYYWNYASETERKEMDREDKMQDMLVALIWLGFIGLLFVSSMVG